jgi:electron transport complex protein RnfG
MVTAITGIILGVVHDITLKPIEETQKRLKQEALNGALPEAGEFSEVKLAEGADPIIKDAWKATKDGAPAGFCVTVLPKGYGGPVEIVAGITNDGRLRAIRILNQSETPGLGAKSAEPQFYGQFDNKDAPTLKIVKTAPGPDEIQAISGATITSTAVTNGVNTALAYWRSNLAPGGNGTADAVSEATPATTSEEEKL